MKSHITIEYASRPRVLIFACFSLSLLRATAFSGANPFASVHLHLHSCYLRQHHGAARPPSMSKTSLCRAISRIVIVPGNGCTPIEQCNWYSWLKKGLEKDGLQVSMQDMPDPYEAKQTIWLPFMRDVLQADENSIIVGHSSGAEAAMRYCEENRVRGIVLVAACHSDLGHPSEAISGYYNRPWLWETIKSNSEFVSQFADREDCFIPFAEAEVVHKGIGTELIATTRGDHFMVREFPELLQHIKSKLQS